MGAAFSCAHGTLEKGLLMVWLCQAAPDRAENGGGTAVNVLRQTGVYVMDRFAGLMC